MRDSAQPVLGTFTLRTVTNGTAEVLGENRSVPVMGGLLKDPFDGYGVHLYKIPN
jgi:hypothetical protein